ncbi:hypothetical protein [Nonomuraea basaltis]|uniref:hypothetical protein n=1 Tax=Nonomuraea basaltis TaxID=2495887 RepID=UPI00110C4BC1|nr:hypothetical protein [Nonomuraea basaltis]TMR91210.1 hypothetical protein EJK15_51145 [Nonomuraea basaltis]
MLTHEMWPYEGRFLLHAPADQVAGRIPGTVEPVGEHSCLLVLRGDEKERVRALGRRLLSSRI